MEVCLQADIAMRFAPVGNPKSAVLACFFAHRTGRGALLYEEIVET